MISDISLPDSSIVRQAQELARDVSDDMLFNHVMRCYWFSELFAQLEGVRVDSELVFLSAVFHDLGLTDHARGPHRFEIESASAARTFLVDRTYSDERAQKVWDNIALHTWDINLFRDTTSRITQLGIAHDVVGVPDARLDPADVAELLRRHPRLNFSRAFHDALEHDLDSKQPYPMPFIRARGSPTIARRSRSWTCGRCSRRRRSMSRLGPARTGSTRPGSITAEQK